MRLFTLWLLILRLAITIAASAGENDDLKVDLEKKSDDSPLREIWDYMIPGGVDALLETVPEEGRQVKYSGSSPPKFDTLHEYVVFAQQQRDAAPQECSETSSPQDCQRCLTAALIAWTGALSLCVAESAAGVLGVAAAVICAGVGTSVFWIARIKCLSL